ncbi:MAG: hypothetical protein ACI4EA_10095, partial [Candidatus Ornithomonoglobus sp.]
VLGTPPAFVLSQDQTLVHMVTVRATLFSNLLVYIRIFFVKPLDNTSSIACASCLENPNLSCAYLRNGLLTVP